MKTPHKKLPRPIHSPAHTRIPQNQTSSLHTTQTKGDVPASAGSSSSGQTLISAAQSHLSFPAARSDSGNTERRHHQGGLTVAGQSTQATESSRPIRSSGTMTLRPCPQPVIDTQTQTSRTTHRATKTGKAAAGPRPQVNPVPSSRSFTVRSTVGSSDFHPSQAFKKRTLTDRLENYSTRKASINWFEKLPVEVVCIILEMTVALPPEPYADGDDGDGPKIGNPIFYWHTDPTRVTLRLVCRSWNQIILSMARDVHVEIGADESLKTMKASEEARSRRIATTSSSNRGRGNKANQSDRNMNLGSPSIADPTVRRSVRIAATSMSSTSNSPYSSTLNLRTSSQSYNDILAEEAVRQYGVYSDRHPRLYQRIMQAQSDKRRAVNQIPIPLQVFYNLRTPAAPSGDVQASSKARESSNPWSCPPNINSLFIYGTLPKMSHPQENEVLLPGSSAAGSSAGGGSFHDNPDCPEYHIKEDDHGTALDHWLRAAVPRHLTKFSINCSSDFGLSGYVYSLRRCFLQTLSYTDRFDYFITCATLFDL